MYYFNLKHFKMIYIIIIIILKLYKTIICKKLSGIYVCNFLLEMDIFF